MTAPNFFVVGAPKAGTSTLYRCLAQHPSVYMSPIKEPCFFAPEVIDYTPGSRELFETSAPGLRAYLDGPLLGRRTGIVLEWEQYLKLFKRVVTETAIGEASVSYLGSTHAPRAIRSRIPHARIVMMLRDPVDRLFSQYAAARAADATNLRFVAWTQEQRAAEATRNPPFGPVWAGKYATHLQRYLEHFPQDQVRAYLLDDFTNDAGAVLRDLLAFLGVDPDWAVDTRHRENVTRVPRWPLLHRMLIRPLGPAIREHIPAQVLGLARGLYLGSPRQRPTPEERAEVIGVYAEDICGLEGLLHRQLAAWLDPHRAVVT